MPRRKGSGLGSVFQRQDGRWCAQVSTGEQVNGRARYKTVYDRTQKDVSDKLKKLLRDQQLTVDIAPGRTTVGRYLERWLEDTAKPTVRVSTYRSYAWLVNKHIIPHNCRIVLEKLAAGQIQAFLAERHASGLSVGTIKHIRATLRAALSQAQDFKLVSVNAARRVKLPRGERCRPTVLTPDQARQLLKVASTFNIGTLVATALSLGLRHGELLALMWEDVDLEHGTVSVRHSLERQAGAGLRLCEPKSEKAKRTLRLPALTIGTLQEQRARQVEAKQWAGPKWQEAGFVLTTSKGTPITPSQSTASWTPS